MPETPPDDDRFADLFGKLPSPPERPASSSSDAPAASSRRAAREARGATGATPTQQDAASQGTPAASQGTAAAPPTTVADDPRPATATLEALFTETTGERPRPTSHDRDRRKSRIAAWAVFVVILGILGGIVAGGFWVWNTYEEPIREFMGWTEPKDFDPGMAEGQVTVTIVSGDTGSTISQTLFDAGVTKTPDAFYDYLIETGQNPNFIPGAYSLQQQMTSAAALEALEDPANKLENTAQLPEGLTVAQMLPRLAEGLGLPLEDFQAAVADPGAYGVQAQSLEGWLFPATYTFDPGTTAAQVIQAMVDRTAQSLDAAGVPVDQRERILNIASIIQREARFEADFYKVSRVIENRMQPNDETNGYLQMDSTAQYGYLQTHPDVDPSGTTSSRAEELADDNGWNTYVHTGLPVGPIANPGDVAIQAAMNPEEGPWLYFVTVNLDTGETIFTSTLAEHEQAVAQWTAWCEANPDSGC